MKFTAIAFFTSIATLATTAVLAAPGPGPLAVTKRGASTTTTPTPNPLTKLGGIEALTTPFDTAQRTIDRLIGSISDRSTGLGTGTGLGLDVRAVDIDIEIEVDLAVETRAVIDPSTTKALPGITNALTILQSSLTALRNALPRPAGGLNLSDANKKIIGEKVGKLTSTVLGIVKSAKGTAGTPSTSKFQSLSTDDGPGEIDLDGIIAIVTSVVGSLTGTLG